MFLPPVAARMSSIKHSSRLPGMSWVFRVTVSNLADLDRLYETVKQQKGRIDILFANAGIFENASLESITEEHFDKIFSVN